VTQFTDASVVSGTRYAYAVRILDRHNVSSQSLLTCDTVPRACACVCVCVCDRNTCHQSVLVDVGAPDLALFFAYMGAVVGLVLVCGTWHVNVYDCARMIWVSTAILSALVYRRLQRQRYREYERKYGVGEFLLARREALSNRNDHAFEKVPRCASSVSCG
jgi:hypothetical protein